jgi:hypothetical protein
MVPDDRRPGDEVDHPGDDELVTVERVRALLAEWRVEGALDARIELLTGGVSSFVYRVSLADDCFVLKQARRRLDVAREWLADPRRAETEAAFAEVATTIVPGAVPRPRFVDPARHAFAMDNAPDGAVTWKHRLLDGDVDVAIARRTGVLLGRIHRATTGDPAIAARFADLAVFDQLRVDAYLRSMAVADPAAAARVAELAEGAARSQALPGARRRQPEEHSRNADWRRHPRRPRGGALRRPRVRRRLLRLPPRAQVVPRAGPRPGPHRSSPRLLRVVPRNHGRRARVRDARGRPDRTLLLARIDGKSPVEYLDEPTRAAVRTFAIGRLRAGATAIDRLLDDVAIAVHVRAPA